MTSSVMVSILVILGAFIQLSDQSDIEVELIDHLFNRSQHSKLAHPVDDRNKSLEVDYKIGVQRIDYVDIRQNKVQLQLWRMYTWNNYLLAWNPEDFGQVKEVRLPTSMIWIPDIHSMDSDSQGNFEKLAKQTDVIVTSEGTCLWFPGGTQVFLCPMDPAWFPFDEYECSLVFVSWSYGKSDVNFTSGSDAAVLSDYTENKQWELLDASAQLSRKDPVFLTYKFRFRRRSFHESLLVFLPTSLLSLMSLFSFSLPVSCQERIVMGVLQLLSIGMLWLHISENRIPQAYSITLADVYYATMFCGSFIWFLLTVQVHRMYYRNSQMPSRFKRMMAFLSKLFLLSDKQGYNDLIADEQPGASYDGNSARLQVNTDEEDRRAEWVLASRVVDRIFFFFFLVFFILTCVIIFTSVPR